MSDSALIFLLLPGLFISVVLSIEIGRRMARRPPAEATIGASSVFATIQTGIYALLGLMIAFTFASAASRFEARRSLTVDEANAIGTAYLRLDLLPSGSQPALRAKFRRYTEERIEVHRALPDMEASNAHSARAVALQSEIWSDSVAALADKPLAAALVLPALNTMIDITTTRAILLRTHTPAIVVTILIVLTIVCSLLIGNELPRERTLGAALHAYGFALVVTLTMYVIFDLDHPRVGLIRLDYTDQALSEVLASMK